MSNILENVAVIGAGLGGCALALALSAQKIPITVYESRPKNSDVLRSGVILTPNGLRVLDQLGVFARIKDRCFTSTHRIFKNDKDETIKNALVTNEEMYGYRNHRIWRKVLLDEMKQMLEEREVVIKYDSKFQGIVSDTSNEGVGFIVNDAECKASLLIGLDGIYSQVRDHLEPNIEPEYTGTVGVLSHIERDSVDWPYPDYERNATIQGKPGAIFFIPEDGQWKDIMVGTQVQYPEQSREDLDRLQTDHDKLVSFYRKGYEEHGPTARSIIDRVTENKENCFIWPYLRMPKLKRWFSSTGRVVLAGDGAHALPPSSGQGVNQALEDIYSLTLLLTWTEPKNGTKGPSEEAVLNALDFWQQMRQERIDIIFDWATNYQNVERLPEAERKKRTEAANSNAYGDDMSWLYKPRLEQDVREWLDKEGRR